MREVPGSIPGTPQLILVEKPSFGAKPGGELFEREVVGFLRVVVLLFCCFGIAITRSSQRSASATPRKNQVMALRALVKANQKPEVSSSAVALYR